MEEFVETEVVIAEVGLLESIKDGTGNVESSTDADQDGGGDAGSEEVRQIEQCATAKGNVDGHVEPAWSVRPEQSEQDSKGCPAPDQP